MPDLTQGHPLVLVADPNPETTVLIERRLEWAGYEVATASCGEEAMELLAAKRPDAAILEVVLGDMTGYDFVREIRRQPANRLMAMALMSERAGALDREFAFTVGADEYFRKPFCSSDVVKRLAELIPDTEAREARLTPQPNRRLRIAHRPPRRSLQPTEAAALAVLAR
jgi:CheY-like chemotaxis protein